MEWRSVERTEKYCGGKTFPRKVAFDSNFCLDCSRTVARHTFDQGDTRLVFVVYPDL